HADGGADRIRAAIGSRARARGGIRRAPGQAGRSRYRARRAASPSRNRLDRQLRMATQRAERELADRDDDADGDAAGPERRRREDRRTPAPDVARSPRERAPRTAAARR